MILDYRIYFYEAVLSFGITMHNSNLGGKEEKIVALLSHLPSSFFLSFSLFLFLFLFL